MKSVNLVLAMSSLLSIACLGQAGSATSNSSTEAANAANGSNVCRIYFLKPKPGAEMQLEAGRKKHMQFHKSQNDTWTWTTFAIETGMNTGVYVTSTCGHAWKDFDDWEKRMGKADTADANANLNPFTQSTWNGFYVYRSDMSLGAANRPPTPMTAVTVYTLHPGAQTEFIDAIKKIGDALSKQPDWPKTTGWLQLVNGGEGPTFVILNSRQNWADFAPLKKSVQDVVNETYGKDGADAIFKTIRDSTEHLYTESAVYRPDLSYIPTKP
jgi:hypothetical protein